MAVPMPSMDLEVSQGRVNFPSGIQTTVKIVRQICSELSIPIDHRRYKTRTLSHWSTECLRISLADIARVESRLLELQTSAQTRRRNLEKVEFDRQNRRLRKRDLAEFFNLKPDVVDLIGRTSIERWDELSPDALIRIGDFEDARRRFPTRRTKAYNPPKRQYLAPPEAGRVCPACDRPISANGRCGCSS